MKRNKKKVQIRAAASLELSEQVAIGIQLCREQKLHCIETVLKYGIDWIGAISLKRRIDSGVLQKEIEMNLETAKKRGAKRRIENLEQLLADLRELRNPGPG